MSDNSDAKLHFLDYWKVIKQRAGLITLVFLLVMITAGVTTYFMPRRYLAVVTMLVNPDNTKSVDFFERGGRSFDPQFVATQFQILKKTEILAPVIQQLHLETAFAGDGPPLTQQQVLGKLVRSLDMQEVRNTGLIEVGAWSTNPQEAADIANTISVVYRNNRLESVEKSTQRGFEQIQDELNKRRKEVTDLAVTAARIRERDLINDPEPESNNTPIGNRDREPVAVGTSVTEQRVKVDQIRSSLRRIEELKPEELREALRTLGIEDATVNTNLPVLLQARVEEKNLLNSGLGQKHPHIVGLRAKMVELKSILAEALDGIRHAEATKLQLAEETLAALEQREKDTNINSIENKAKGSEYVDAKAKYLTAKRILEVAETQYATQKMANSVAFEPVHIYQPATKPLWPDYPPVKQYLFAAVFIGLVMGLLLAFFIEYLDTSVKTIDDVERYLKSSILAVIPKGIPVLLKIRGEHADAEAYRILRANMEFNKPSPDAKSLTVISAGPGEGKSTTLNNLAYTCAKGGYNVLVIDADLRRPSQHTFFETDNSLGLVDYLTGSATIDAITRTTKIDNLSFIPSGELSHDMIGVLNSEPMTQLIEKVKSQYDLIFFDSPPILGVSDGSVIASEMDMTVMVVQHRRFPRAMLVRVKQAVEQVGGALIGVVLNNVDTRQDEGYSYYNAYQDYYAAPQRQASPEGRRAPAPRKSVGAPAVRHHGDEAEY